MPAVDVIAPDLSPEGLKERSKRARRQLRLVRDRAVPVVRWAGGKTKLLDEIVSRSPATYRRYIEPFCGGAALFFRLRPERALVSDSCVELIELYCELSRDPQGVFTELRTLTMDAPRAAYYATRAAWNEKTEKTGETDDGDLPRLARLAWTASRRAATFLYLNKTCYNGLWRKNASGDLNTPVGKFGAGGEGDPGYPVLADLVAAGDALRRAEISCGDYSVSFDRALPGDFLYADPPYPPRSKTASFTSYTAGGFDEGAQRLLAQRVHALVDRGVQVVVSQADVPLTREIYDGLTLHEVSAPRSVNSKAGGRGHVPELLVTGGFSP